MIAVGQAPRVAASSIPDRVVPRVELTTLWDFRSQSDPGTPLGSSAFHGATPGGVAWNLVARYTRPGDVVVDAMCGSGTMLDAARMMGRHGVGCDIAPQRSDVVRADARALPFPDDCADLCFVDPPYSDNVRYSEEARCIGKLSCHGSEFFEALDGVAREVARIVRPRGVAAWLISDGYKSGRFAPVGFRLFEILSKYLAAEEIVCVVRRNDRSLSPMWEHRARRFGFLLRGFKYLFIMRKARLPFREG